MELRAGEGGGRVRERIDEYDVEEKVVIVTVTGEGEEVMAASIEEYGDEQGALTTRVNDRRELEEATSADVSFADPDEAVQQRIREMGLSPAARDLDETIRASKVADSNVADEVQRRVSEFVTDADAGAFDPVEDASDDDSPAEPTADDGSTVDSGAEQAETTAEPEAEQSQVTMEDYL